MNKVYHRGVLLTRFLGKKMRLEIYLNYYIVMTYITSSPYKVRPYFYL
jgi:hypothetical protein